MSSKGDDDAVRFACPACGAGIKMRAVYAGRDVDCPGCGKALKVPGQDATTPARWPTWAVVVMTVIVTLILVGSVWLALALSGRGPGLPGVFASPEDKLCDEIAAHAFWRGVKLTRADARSFGTRLVAAKGNDVAFLDDSGRLEVVEGLGSDFPFRAVRDDNDPLFRGLATKQFKPGGVGDRYILFDLKKQYAVKPDLGTVLRDILAAISVADYHK